MLNANSTSTSTDSTLEVELQADLQHLQHKQAFARRLISEQISNLLRTNDMLSFELSMLAEELSLYRDDIEHLKSRKADFSDAAEKNTQLHKELAQALEENIEARKLATHYTKLRIAVSEKGAASPR